MINFIDLTIQITYLPKSYILAVSIDPCIWDIAKSSLSLKLQLEILRLLLLVISFHYALNTYYDSIFQC